MAYFAQSIVTPTLAEGAIGEALIETIGASRALNDLMLAHNLDGDPKKREFAEGLHQLVETQCLIFAGIQNAIELQELVRKSDALEAAETARKGRETGDQVKAVRRAIILDQAKAGVDPVTISQALGIRVNKVADVIAQAERT